VRLCTIGTGLQKDLRRTPIIRKRKHEVIWSFLEPYSKIEHRPTDAVLFKVGPSSSVFGKGLHEN